MKRLLFLLLAIQLSFSTAVVNSLDGRDVVSTIYYAAYTNDDIVFVTPVYSEGTVYGKTGSGKDVLLVQSADNVIITGMKNELENKGNTVEVITSEDPYETNLLLAERSGAKKFILVDPVYGYNTVSVLAYAKLNSMYLIFVDKNNLDSVMGFFESNNPSDILIYGYIDSEVKNSLDENRILYREINNGDKYDDNMEIADMYFEQNPSKQQVVVSDGNSFDDTIAEGNDPVVFISQLVPLSVYNYMKEKAVSGQIQVAMVVDQEYAPAVYDMKESINHEVGEEVLHVIVKLGEGTDTSGAGMEQVPLFPLPGPVLGLTIKSAEYNTLSKELEITYENTGNAPEYVRSQILVFVDGNYASTVGDDEPFALGRSEKLGIGYPVEIEEGSITVNITSFYGSSKKSVEHGIQTIMSAGRVEFSDESLLEVSEFSDDQEDLYVTFTNGGNVVLYFKPDVTVDVEGKTTKIEDENIYTLTAGESRIIKFPAIAKPDSDVTAGADYGAREAFLEKRVENTYTPGSGIEFDMNLLYIIVIIILIVIVVYLFKKKK